MDVSMSEIIRETRNAINSRLDMLEILMNNRSAPMSNNETHCDNHRIDSLYKKILYLDDKYEMIESTMYKFNDLITNVQKKIESMEKQNAPILSVMDHKKIIRCNSCQELVDDCYCDMPPLTSISEIIPEIIVNEEEVKEQEEEEEYCDNCGGVCDGGAAHGASGDAALADMKLRGLEVRDTKIVPIVNEVVEEEEEQQEEEEEVVEEEVVEEVVEEEVVELEEFEYKGMTLYRAASPDNKVYRMDEDGCISVSNPLGIWDEKSKKIKKL